MRFGFALIIGLLFTSAALAQESSVQQTNPASLKFYQLNTPYFKILFPEGFEQEAQRMANTLDRIHEPEGRTMGASPKRIPVILQNQSAISNAFVTLAPRRTEFYAMPSQNYNFIGTNDWMTLLASHEYRHVVQFQRSITGFNKFFYYLFGQQALAGFASAAAPQWFWEGDAVATETAFTHSGRGRIPNFNLLLRTNFLEGRTFNYHKQYLRSYRNNIPNHYVLGYHMVSYLRKKTGDPQIWEKIAGRAWSAPFIPFTFSNAIHHETGLYVKDLYKEMAASVTEQWKKEEVSLTLTPQQRVNPRNTTAYTDYLYPQVLDDGSIVAQKSGIGDIERLVVLKESAEKKMFVQGIVNETGMMSAAGSRIVWNEYRFDPRWQVKTFTMIEGYDAATGKKTIVSSGSRYAGAALSPDGTQVVTVETGTNYQTRLLIIDYNSGNVVKQFDNPNNDFISMARFTPDGKNIIALTSNKEGKTIAEFSIATGTSVNLIERTQENVGSPILHDKYVLYSSPYSNIDNLYALDTETGKRFQVTSSKYGAYNPVLSKDGKTIYYNDQSRNGMDVVETPFNPSAWKGIEEVTVAPGFYEHLVKQEGRPGLLDSVPNKNYDVKRYRRASGMVNVHSWGPFFNNSFAQANFGLYSQDVLSTTSISGGYQYDINEKTGALQAGVSYQGFYPILDFNVLSGNRVDKFDIQRYNVKFNWHETTTTAGIRLPLILTRSKYFSQVEIGNEFAYTRISSFTNKAYRNDSLIELTQQRFVPVDITIPNGQLAHAIYVISDRLDNGNLLYNYFHVNWFHALKTSSRDFNPKFAQYFYFDHYSTPYGGNFKGAQWLARTILFFPGLAKHHSLFFRAGYQNAYSNVNVNTYTFRNHLFKPRGFSYPNDQAFTTLSANYQMPVAYPDIALGPILNIQRIKTNFFYDYGNGRHTNYYYVGNEYYYNKPQATYTSQGVEVTFDVNVMRLLQQIELGFRVTRTNPVTGNSAYPKGALVYEFLIGNIPF